MIVSSRPATRDEVHSIWPAARASHLMSSLDGLLELHDSHPEWIRVTDGGGAVVLDRWREDPDLLAIEGLWAPTAHITDLVRDVIRLTGEWGHTGTLSPLVTDADAAPYLDAGMRPHARLVAFTRPLDRLSVMPDTTQTPRLATPEDAEAILAVDAACFGEFWRYGTREVARALAGDRVTVCAGAGGEVAGYLVVTLRGVSATISRVAVDPRARRSRVASALIADALRWARDARALGVSLCTQEENSASRALYRAMGFSEVVDRYSLLVTGAQSA